MPHVRSSVHGPKKMGAALRPFLSFDLLFRPSTREILTINAEYDPLAEVSSRPERTRISCHAALDKAACAPFRKDKRMKRNNVTKFHRKSGVAQWRDLLFPSIHSRNPH